jgi:hypothetical protein
MPKLLLDIFNIMDKAQPIGVVGAIRPFKNNPLIVSADQLHVLLSRPDCLIKTLDKPYKVVRFLLRFNGELVFAAEGYPFAHIPAHYQMASMNPFDAVCISAGNAFFDKNNKLCVINHQSGDFRPSFNSLQFALNAFSRSHVPMEKKITVMRLNTNGVNEQDYSINAEDIKDPTLDAASKDVSYELPVTTTQNINYQNKLEACALLGLTITQQIKRLEKGAISHDPYWMNSSKKLKAIISALNELPPQINEAQLKLIVKNPNTQLYKALNIQRLSPMTFFGRLGWNNAKSLQSVNDVLTNNPNV